MAFKIAFIGTHGVGKTTLVYGLASRLKRRDLALEVLVEVARRCPLPLNEETTAAAQRWILHTQISDELIAESRNPLVLCDRSVLDNYVYLLSAVGREAALESLIDSWLPSYDLLVRVPVWADSDMLSDGVRATDPAFRDRIDELLIEEIRRRELSTIELDPNERDGWLDAVEQEALRHLEPAQMTLL